MTRTSSNTLHILHLDDGRGWRGGQHQVFLLMQGLAKEGVRQALAAPGDEPLAQRAREAGIEVIDWKYGGELDFLGAGRLAKLVRERGANFIHAHTGHAHALGVAAAKRLGDEVRLVSTRRVDFDVGGNWFSRKKYQWPGQFYIAISEAVKCALVKGGVAPGRIAIVHSGVPPVPEADRAERETARGELGIAPNEIAIVSVGALVDHKDHRTLIDAVPAVIAAEPRVCFHLLGEGEKRGELEARIRELGIGERVRLHGFVPGARKKLDAFDCFVQSSKLEGLGTAVIDAVWAGLPVAATAAGGVPEIIVGGRTGLLAPPGDPGELARIILATLGDPDAARTRCARALEHVRMHFSAGSMALGTLGVYREWMERGQD